MGAPVAALVRQYVPGVRVEVPVRKSTNALPEE